MKYLVSVGIVAAVARAAAAAPGPLDGPVFAATPADLRAAAASTPASGDGVTILRDDVRVVYDDAGRATTIFTTVARVDTPAAVDDWGTISLGWRPFYEDRPVARARVIAPDGSVTELDPSLAHDAPVVSESPQVFSDARELQMPLPRLVVGAIVEEEFVEHERVPTLSVGGAARYGMTRRTPIGRVRFEVDRPTGRAVAIVPRGFAKAPRAQVTTAGGRTITRYDLGRVDAVRRFDPGLPGDVVSAPMFGVSSAPSWAAVARAYDQLAEAAIKDAPALPPGLVGATDQETIDRIVAWVHDRVRYTGIELDQSAYVPSAPSATLTRGFGDCKDQAALLVALLRAAHLPANLVLLSTGPGLDVDRALPGMMFDHAIVRARAGGRDVWIDATEPDLPAGQLPSRDQGRLALIVAPDTRDLTPTPVAANADNLIREVRTYRLAELDHGSVHEETVDHGVFAGTLRAMVRDTARTELEKQLADYAQSTYESRQVTIGAAPRGPVTQPYTMVLDVADSPRVHTDQDEISVVTPMWGLVEQVPSIFTEKEGAQSDDVATRVHDYVFAAPHVHELEYRIELPPAYDPPHLPSHETRAMGAMRIDIDRRVEGATYVIAYRLDTGKRRITAADVRATRAAVRALAVAPMTRLSIPRRGATLIATHHLDEAIADARRLIALHPREARHHHELALAYRAAGLIPAAKREARAGVALEPKNPSALTALAIELRFDSLGRLYGFDADRAGAIAAARQALALSPNHMGALTLLAELRGTDDRGATTSDPAGLREAAALQARKLAVADTEEQRLATVTAQVLAGQFADAQAEARDLPASDRATELRLATRAGLGDAAAAVAEVGAAGRDRASAARFLLVRARAYDAMRALGAAAGIALPQDTLVRAHDLRAGAASDPLRAARLVLLAAGGLPVPSRPWSSDMDEVVEADARAHARTVGPEEIDLVPTQVMTEFAIAGATLSQSGDARTGWVIEAAAGRAHETVFVALDHGTAKVVALASASSSVGTLVLATLDRRDDAGARRWFERYVAAAGRDHTDRLDAVVARWTELSAAGAPARDDVEVLAALLSGKSSAARAVAPLRRCAAGTAPLADLCRERLLNALRAQGQFAAAAEAAAAILKVSPDDHAALRAHAFMLAAAGQTKAAVAAADEALRRFPNEREFAILRAQVAVAAEPWPAAEQRVAALGIKDDEDRNEIAWLRAFHDTDLTVALALAHQLTAPGRTTDPHELNTAATVEAAAGERSEAWDNARKSFGAARWMPPLDAEWLVVGRIAEAYGMRDDAIAAYRRVGGERSAGLVPTARDFAVQGLARLGAK